MPQSVRWQRRALFIFLIPLGMAASYGTPFWGLSDFGHKTLKRASDLFQIDQPIVGGIAVP